jgi:hypothetical protein
MTTAQRLYNYITLLAVINIDNRPRLVTRSEGDPIIKTCPFAIFEDLKESAYLMEFSNGVRPYILEWYNDVFLVEFNDKRERNTVDNEETIIGVRSYQFYPVLNEKQKKLFDVSESTNFLQRKMMHVVGSTIFPNRNYLISKILGVLRYSYKRHKLTRLENNEGKEITVEELVDHYYKDPDRYFEIDNCKAATAKTNDGVTTATTPLAISRTL